MSTNAAGVLLLIGLFALPASAQERGVVVSGWIGGATLGHADSEMGKAPIFGAGIGLHLLPRLLVEGDVHTGAVSNVFGRAHHDFRETTFTASVLFRSNPDGDVHFLGGGGLGVQRVHSDVNDPPFVFERTETIRLWHGRAGVEWGISPRLAIRTEGIMSFGEGLDWVVGGRAGVSYRF